MMGSVDLRFLPAARQDLKKVGRLARPLLSAGIRDQVVLSFDDRTAIPPQKVSKVFSGTEGTDVGAWYVLPVGSYEAVVRPFFEDGSPGGAVVGRIFEGGELNALMPDLFAGQ